MATPVAGTSRLLRYWPVVACGGLILLSLAYLFIRRQDPLIKAWGMNAAGACTTTFDGRFLESYAREYDVIAICGVDLPSTDRSSSVAISVSPTFRIENRDYEIQIFPSPAMRAARDYLDRNSRPAETAAGAPARSLSLWFEVVLLPKGRTPEEVQSVSDVEKLNGLRFPDETRETTVQY
jgi:hypothetical protein